MKKIIYIEKEINNSPRVKKILNKYMNYEKVYVDKYTEVFNKKNQNFQLQKKNPSIIIAKKNKNFLSKIPKKYNIGNNYNFYFSYMYNCIFDCKYCFLQGLYNSANFVIFINYEDYFLEIKKIKKKINKEKATIFAGYDCDSLAYDSYTDFINPALRFFSKHKDLELELRTKSTLIKPLMKKSLDNVIIAYSFTPEKFSKVYEIGVPSVKKRLLCIKKLVDKGWKIGLRFDPIITYEGWKDDYEKLFSEVFKIIPKKQMHSVTFGNLRYPKSQFNKIKKASFDQKLFFSLKKNKSFFEDLKKETISNFCYEKLKFYVTTNKIFKNF